MKAEKNFFVAFSYKLILLVLTGSMSLLDVNIEIMTIYSLIVYSILIIIYYRKEKRFFSEYMVVLLFMILFHSGQAIVHLFDAGRYLPVFRTYPDRVILNGIVYSLLCIQIFDAAFCAYEPGVRKKIKHKKCSAEYLNLGYQISKAALILLTPIVFAATLIKTVFSLKYGYMSLYAYSGAGYTESSLMPYIRNLFVVMCILNITSSSYDEKKSRIPLALMAVYGFLMFVSGSRSGCLGVILPAILIYTTNIKKMKKEKLLKILAVFFLLVFASVFMSYFRLLTDKTGMSISEAVNYAVESNPLTETMIEMGGSLQPLLYCVMAFSNGVSFKLGSSYIASLLLLIPNLFHVLGDVHPASETANLSQWLMDYMHLDHGPGFSIIAESYYNFGSWGWFVFIIWGVLLCRILGDPEKQNEERNFISYAGLTFIFSLIRGSTSDFTRYFFYEVILVNFIVRSLSIIISKRKG